jgi:glycosyltransferase involved in cell wall biosynthesis
MKILHICLGERYVDGYGYQENILTKVQKRMGYDVSILASTATLINKLPGFAEPSEYVNEYGIPVKRIPFATWLPHKLCTYLRLYQGTYSAIKKNAPDIIFVHGASFLDIKEIVKYKKDTGIKVYVDSHADYINSGRNWLSFNLLHRIIYRHCYSMIIPFAEKFFGTLPLRNKYLHDVFGVPNNKIELLPMGVDLSDVMNLDKNALRSEMRAKYGYNDEDFVVATGGKIFKRKKTVELIKAVLLINDPRVKLFLFGSISEELKDEIDALIKKAPNRILYCGWVDAKEIYKYLLLGDLYVYPGTHSAIWEQTVGLGQPCVFKKWEDIDHVDLDGNCVIIEDTTPEGIAQTIESLYNDKDELQRMRSVAESKGPNAFSFDKIARKAIGFDN